MNEAGLLKLAAAGDAAAFGLLVRAHQSQLRGFLLRLTRRDAALADDVAQETFLEAWRSIAKFRGEGAFAGWLARIAYRRYLKHARERKLEPLEEVEDVMPAVSHEARLDLESAMAKLSAPQRAAITICFALGYSHEEAARVLEMPVGTVKSHIARGRERLRALLE